MKLIKHTLVAAVALCALQAQARVTVFADSFDANALGLNAVPTGWAVTEGTVDIIGASDFYDFIPGSGRYIDLDGSTGDAGVLSRSFAVTSGHKYFVSFELAGNQRNSSVESVTVNFGPRTVVKSLEQSAGWRAYRPPSFIAANSGMASLTFSNAGGDNIGMLLDNVNVTSIPEPGTYAMLLAGLAAVGFVARRRAL